MDVLLPEVFLLGSLGDGKVVRDVRSELPATEAEKLAEVLAQNSSKNFL